MSSPDPEARPTETSPLLGSNQSARSQHEEDREETSPQPRQNPSSQEWLGFWFFAALGTGILTAAFLLTEWWMALYGEDHFWYHEFTLKEFQETTFWVILVSVAFNIANLVRIRTTGKSLPILLNMVFLAILTAVLIYGVSSLVEDQTWRSDYRCREQYDDNPNRNDKPPGSLEDCLKWAPKMKAIVILLAFFAGFHAIILGRLLIAVLEDIFSVTSRYFRGGSSNLAPGRGQVTLQVSLGWGAPQQTALEQQDSVQNQARREPEAAV